jgi:hypothetical protein
MVKDKTKINRKDKQSARSDSKKLATYSKSLKGDVAGDRYRAAAGRLSEIEALSKVLDPKIVNLSKLQDEKRHQEQIMQQARAMNSATKMAKKADKKVLKAQIKQKKYELKSNKKNAQKQGSQQPMSSLFKPLKPWNGGDDTDAQNY